MRLIIRRINQSTYGIYKCVSKNSLGETDGTINVYRKYYRRKLNTPNFIFAFFLLRLGIPKPAVPKLMNRSECIFYFMLLFCGFAKINIRTLFIHRFLSMNIDEWNKYLFHYVERNHSI